MKRDRPNRTITLSQEPAIRKLLQQLDMQEANGKDTPMAAGAKLSKKDSPGAEQALVMINEQRWYRSTVASLIYFVSWTRPDLAYAVGKHCKFMHNPGQAHIASLKRVIRYLKHTAHYGLKYDFSTGTSGRKEGVFGRGEVRCLRRGVVELWDRTVGVMGQWCCGAVVRWCVGTVGRWDGGGSSRARTSL